MDTPLVMYGELSPTPWERRPGAWDMDDEDNPTADSVTEPVTVDEPLRGTAVRHDCNCEYPMEDQLFLDIDSTQALAFYVRQLRLLQQFEPAVEVDRRHSRHGNWHVTVTLGHALTVPERIAYQAVLGSDLTRELLCLVKHHAGIAEPTVFFVRRRG